MKKIIIFLGIIFIIFLFLGEDNSTVKNKIFRDLDFENNFDVGNTLDKGERLLGIDITMDKCNDYIKSVKLAEELKFDFTTLSISWDDIEIKPYEYKNENLKLANDYYPGENIKLAVIITPIDTNNLRLPKDLKDKKLNDKEVINRFKGTIDFVLKELNNVDIISLSIGNEIDLYLQNDVEKWNEYTIFYKEISEYLHKKNNNLKIGTKITLYGLTKDNINNSKKINKYSDTILATYYPLNNDFSVKNIEVVDSDLKLLVNLYKKEIQLLESGYPEGKYTKSSVIDQSLFFHQLFQVWDKYKNSIKVVNINWLHDRSSTELSYFKKYYGSGNKAFLDFLGSLGLISYNGDKKSSFYIIKKEIKARKW